MKPENYQNSYQQSTQIQYQEEIDEQKKQLINFINSLEIGSIQENKYHQESERPSYLDRISQSALINPNDSIHNPQCNISYPTISNHSQPSQNKYRPREMEEGNSQVGPSISQRGNESQASFRSMNQRNMNQSQQILKQLDKPEVNSSSEYSYSEQQINLLKKKFHKQFLYLGYKPTSKNLSRAEKVDYILSQRSRIFKRDKDTGLFIMDLTEQNASLLTDNFLTDLKVMDLYLMYKIEIGAQVKHAKLLTLFQINFQSLRQYVIERKWEQDDDDFKQHGIDFIKNINNQKRLTSIKWISNKITELLVQSFEKSQLINLNQLSFILSQKVENTKECGKMLAKIFNKADKDNKFKMIIESSVKTIDQLERSMKIYKNRVEIRQKKQFNDNQQPVIQNNHSQSAQQQNPQGAQSQKPQTNSQQQVQQPQINIDYKVTPQLLKLAGQINIQQIQAMNQLPPAQNQQGAQVFSHMNFSAMLGGQIGGQKGGISFGNNTYNR